MSMDGTDFDWFYDLTPEEQQQVLYEASFAGANTMPYNFGGGFAPELSGVEYDLAGFGGGLPPELNKQGEVMPWGLNEEQQATNVYQDRAQMLADNVIAALGGPGSYGPGAFRPTLEYGGPTLQTPGTTRAQRYAGRGGGGYMKAIADAILAGDDPSTATAKIWELIQKPDSETLDPAERAERDAIIASLPPNLAGGGQQIPTFGGGEEERTPLQQLGQKYDLGRVQTFADELFSEIAGEPDLATGFTDPTTGLTYAAPPKEKWGKAAQWYIDRGLPFPDVEYTSPEMLQEAAPLDPMEQAMREGNILELNAQAQRAGGQAQAAQRQEVTLEEAMRQMGVGGQVRGMPAGGIKPSDAQRQSILQGNLASQFMPPGKPPTEGRYTTPEVPQAGPSARGGFENPATRANRMAAISQGGLASQYTEFVPQLFKTPNPFAALPQPSPVGAPTAASLGYRMPSEAKGGIGGAMQRALLEFVQGNEIGRALTAEDVTKAQRTGRESSKKASEARIAALRARNKGTAAQTNRAEAIALANRMAERGRTPLADAFLQRMLPPRAAGLYGGP